MPAASAVKNRAVPSLFVPSNAERARMAPRDESDLAWFFRDDLKGDLGIQSSARHYELGIPGGGGSGHFEMSDQVLKAADRRRRVKDRLDQVSDTHRNVLRVVFGSMMPLDKTAFGELAAAVVVIPLTSKRHAESGSGLPLIRWLERLACRVNTRNEQTGDRPLVRELTLAAQSSFLSAAKSYEAAPCSRRHSWVQR